MKFPPVGHAPDYRPRFSFDQSRSRGSKGGALVAIEQRDRSRFGRLMASHAGQSGFCALVGAGIGVAVCAGVGLLAANMAHYPFRMLWFSPLLGGAAVVLVSLMAAALSAWPVRKLPPMVVFERR